ncbi:MAG: hypothetical protein GWN33_11330 [Gammaproteobacteria bacterium]|nr:hypothetical protein [Gammaproteobacteria bacterium]
MEWLMAIMFCINNIQDTNPNWKPILKGCATEYAACKGSPGRRDKPCELKLEEYFKGNKS